MSIEYRWGREEDYKRIIELANHAFAENDHTQDFEKNTSETSFFPFILPKLYQNIETAPMHYLAVKDGEFVGNVGLFEQPMMVNGELLHVGGIGTVCVRPGHRREGFMKKLMNDVIEKARADQKDYLILGGQRQRYENWGFGCAGMNSVFTFDYGNFRRLFSEDADFGYSFQKLGKEDRE
ncbi:MAG: GNAT family N-acetyltransferase, partial [Clostridiales bacterium]|nr:GNAT family N-acetyltransferase [Candidatus Blautia equi]